MSNPGGNEYPLIGLVGPAGAGKDTCANLLVAEHRFVQVSFAERLRDFVRAIDPAMAIAEKVIGSYDAAKRSIPGFRDRLIEIGDAARTHINSEVWVDAVDDLVRDHLTSVAVVVSDVRRQNEAEWLWDCDGTLVAVKRPGLRPEDRTMAELVEAADYVIENSGDENDLAAEVADLVTWLDAE